MLVGACGQQARQLHGAPGIPAAQTIYTNARIYTVDANNSWAQAIAVGDGRFLAVGTAEQVLAHKGPATEVIDLGGRMVLPGLHDMHAHLSEAGTKELFECGFPFTLGKEEILTKVSDCASSLPPGEWLRGGQWPMELLDTDKPPSKEDLDAAAPNNPVLLIDSTVHAIWVNSMALQQLGIDDTTVDPVGGIISRDPQTGEAAGILVDNAAYQQMYTLPRYSSEQMNEALAWSIGQFNSVGVTALKDAAANADSLAGYVELARIGLLNAHLATSLAWRMAWAGPQEVLQQTIADRASSSGKGVSVDFVKIMLDGIPPSQTAAVLEPYLPDGKQPAGHNGYLTQSPESLAEDLVALDAQGLSVKIHATGDRSVRVALDAIEAARKTNGSNTRRHEISHAEMIHPDDLPRFAQLNVIAEMCPILWYPSPLHAMMERVLGTERSDHFWPTRTLVESGALVVYGSDWPSVVQSPSPWPGIEAMVTRRDPYGVNAGSLGVEEALDLAAVLRIFTINGAESTYSAETTGSIETGKSADFIVLDRHLFDIDPDEISETVVLSTVFGGRTVHSANRN